MSTWLVPIGELTPDQLRAVQMDTSTHRVIFGAPGSGKTLVLLYRARHLWDTSGTSPERFRIFVYTNALKEYIRSGMDRLDLPEECVLTLDDWCVKFHNKYIRGRLPWDEKARQPDFPAVRAAVLAHVWRSSRPAMPMYDFVLVDEAQDLDENAFGILRAISKHVTVCMDHNQQIYVHGTKETHILKFLGIRQRNISLLGAFRCCPHIVKLSAALLPDPEKLAYEQQSRQPQTEKMTPLLYYARTLDEEFARLVEVLRTRIVSGDRVAILFAQNRPLYACARALKEAGIEVQTQKEADFGSDVPKVMTIFSAKGLTFDSVLMPNLWSKWFERFSSERTERLLFVGITRATRWVYMSAVEGKEIAPLRTLASSGVDGSLTIQRAQSGRQRTLLLEPEQSDDGDDLLDIL